METITIDRHYAFSPYLQTANIAKTEENFSVKVKVTPEGDFEVTGFYSGLKTLVKEITLDDDESTEEIMDTAV